MQAFSDLSLFCRAMSDKTWVSLFLALVLIFDLHHLGPYFVLICGKFVLIRGNDTVIIGLRESDDLILVISVPTRRFVCCPWFFIHVDGNSASMPESPCRMLTLLPATSCCLLGALIYNSTMKLLWLAKFDENILVRTT